MPVVNAGYNKVQAEQFASFPANVKRGRVIYHTGYNSLFVCKLGIDQSADTTLVENWRIINDIYGYETVEFDYTSSSTINIKTLLSGLRISSVSITIDIPFNDLTSTASVGVSSDHNLFMSATDNKIIGSNSFEVYPNYKLLADTLVCLYLNKGTSTAGSGLVILEYL